MSPKPSEIARFLGEPGQTFIGSASPMPTTPSSDTGDGLVKRLRDASEMASGVPVIDELLSEAASRISALEGEAKAALREVSKYAREAGEAKGRLEMSEAAGIVDGWRERAERAEAALTTPPPRLPDSPTKGWRGIETAPRDGTDFLAWFSMPETEAGGIIDHVYWDYDFGPADFLGAFVFAGEGSEVARAPGPHTHWMPLPTPPSGEGGS